MTVARITSPPAVGSTALHHQEGQVRRRRLRHTRPQSMQARRCLVSPVLAPPLRGRVRPFPRTPIRITADTVLRRLDREADAGNLNEPSIAPIRAL